MSENRTPKNSEHAPWEAMSKEGNRNKKRTGLLWLFAVALVALVAYGFREAPVEVEIAAVDMGEVRVEVVEEGKTRIKNRYIISSPFMGEMERVLLKPGHVVKAGETLITSIRSNPANLLDARTKAQAEARVEMAKASLSRAMEQLEIARTAERFAKSNLSRLNTIKQSGSVSETDYEMAERDALIRTREIVAAQAALQMSEYELAQAKAAAKEFEPGEGNKEGVLREIKTPISGVVLQVFQESERAVTVGMPLIEIGDPLDLEIEAEILSKDAVAMKAGDHVFVEQWGGDEPLEARVRLIEPAAFTKVSALGVEEQRVLVIMDLITPREKRARLQDRYRVEVRVATWQQADALRMPAGAAFREGTQWKTFVLSNGKAEIRDLKVGFNDGNFVAIQEGLQVGESVLVHPPDSLKSGSRVAVRTP